MQDIREQLNKVKADLASTIASSQQNPGIDYAGTALKYAPHAAAAAALLAAGTMYGRHTANDRKRKR
jgi:hypothetical protein